MNQIKCKDTQSFWHGQIFFSPQVSAAPSGGRKRSFCQIPDPPSRPSFHRPVRARKHTKHWKSTQIPHKTTTNNWLSVPNTLPTPYQLPTNSLPTPTQLLPWWEMTGWKQGDGKPENSRWQKPCGRCFCIIPAQGAAARKQFFQKKKTVIAKKIFNRFWCISMDDFSFSVT